MKLNYYIFYRQYFWEIDMSFYTSRKTILNSNWLIPLIILHVALKTLNISTKLFCFTTRSFTVNATRQHAIKNSDQ